MEKRNTRRIPLNRGVTLNRNGTTYKGFLLSISENGLQLIVPQAYAHRTNHPAQPLTLSLPISSSRTIDIPCREIWHDGDIMGVRIQDPSAEYKAFYRKSYFKVKKEISHDSIAVIGMGCHYPGAATLKAFWENILARRREFRKLPRRRLPLSDYYDADPTAADKTYGDRAAVIDGFTFDWIKRGIPKTVVDSSDIVHWLALEVALRALEDAGYTRQSTPCDRTGVILGNTLTGEYSRSQNMRLRWPYVGKILKAVAIEKGLSPDLTEDLLQTMEEYYKSAFAPITEDTLAGSLSNTIAGRICNFLDLHGGGYTVDGACSSSLIAVATAATALSNGTLDLAVAGGIDISLDTFELVGFSKTNALTRGDMRVYDRGASGFIPGEGAGFVVLKRLQDARTHGNYVYAILRGWGISSDGKGSLTAPKAQAQALAIRRAYGKAGYDLSSVDFIEGHGTGTAAGDRAEVEGIAMVMDPGSLPDRLRSCGITSLKSLIGHTKAASGIGGFIKAVLAVNRRVIPATAGCSEPNAVFHDKAKALYPVLHGEVHDVDKIMRAGVSGMGFGGINCHVTIESDGRPADRIDTSIGERELLASHQETEIFAVSAPDQKDMIGRIRELEKLAYGISASELTDFSADLMQNIDPAHHFRVAMIAHSPENLIDCLGRANEILAAHEIANDTVEVGPQQDIWVGRSKKAARIGFLFPGQGSQQLGMGKTLTDRHVWARDLVARADHYLMEHGCKKIAEAIYPPVDRALDAHQIETWMKTLSNSEIAQPAICLCSLLWMRHLEHLGITPQAVGGHSLGELTAFYAAGAFHDMALIRFAAFRGGITAAKAGEAGTMAVFSCDHRKAQEIVDKTDGYAVVANINSPGQTAISGEGKAVENAMRLASAQGVRTKHLPVANAFHSRFMADAASTLAKHAPIPDALTGSKIRIFTSIDGTTVKPGTDLRQHFGRQLTHTVDFISLINNMTKECDILVEVGPGRVLSDLARSITADANIHCLPVEAKAGDDRSLNTLLSCYFVHGGSIKWPALFQGRLVKTFIPASKRVFIENPCEHAMIPIDREILQSVRAELPHTPKRATVLKDKTEHPDEQSAGSSAETQQELLALVSRMTGFPIDSISLDHRLLDDLNLDSIKAGELVAKAIRLYHAPGTIDPSTLANSSLKEIYDLIKLEQQKESQLPAGSTPQATVQGAWVRNFTIRYVPRPGSPYLSGDAQQKNVLIVSDNAPGEDYDDISNALRRKLLRTTSIHYDQISTDSPDELRKYDYFIFFLAAGQNSGDMLTAAQSREMVGRMHTIASIITAMNTRIPKPTYAVLQFGGVDFYRYDNATSVGSKGATAFLSSLHHERPQERIRVLQFSRISLPAIEKTVDELRTADTFVTAAYDDNFVRYVPVLTPVKQQEFTPRSVTWSSQDVVLVTGGAKGITAACALAFALKTGVRLALVGRTSNAENDTEIQESLGRYGENNICHRYYACDITDQKSVSSLIGRIGEELGPITGFIHGAAMNKPRRADQVSLEEACEEISPKVLGAINILNALGSSATKLVVAFGSIIGVTGMAGNAWYGFSNEVLNLLLQQFKGLNPAAEVITCAFSIWAEIGMGAKMGSIAFLSKMGIRAIPKEKGIDHFMQLATSTTGSPQIIVAGRLGSLDIMRRQPPDQRARFTQEILFFERGVEIEARAFLTTAHDRYLNHHVFRGIHLFPTVFGIEAMQQAVAAVVEAHNPQAIEMEEIRLSYPITVEPDGQTEIRIRALVEEPDKEGGPTKVKAAVTSDQTGFSRDCFEATFVLNGEQTPDPYTAGIPEEKLDIDPGQDLYGHMLFQGPSFQRIKHIISMTDDQCIFEALTQPPDPDFDQAYEQFVTGDPYFRDTLLQSGQIILPDLIALPMKIDKWEIYQTPQDFGTYRVIVNILQRNTDTVVADVTAVDQNGAIVEKIQGYTVKIIERKQGAPSVNDLISPDRWDEEHINRQAAQLCGEAGTVPPALRIKHIPLLSEMAKAERHQIEQTLFESACQEVSPKPADASNPIAVAWTEQGKPFLPGNSQIALSCCHDAKLLICSAGPATQGCDVEPVVHRDPQEWGLMLGRKRQPLLDRLEKEDNSYDRAATRIWCAVEALRKATDMQQHDLTYSQGIGDCVIFSGMEGIIILTFPVKLLRGPERIIAVATQHKSLSSQKDGITPTNPSTLPESSGEFNDRGPEGQKVFACRFNLGLKDNSTISGGVNFANYAHWLGNVRETALKPIGKYISDEFHSGHFMVTNHTDTHIVRHVRNHESMEARVWIDQILGYKDSSLKLKFEWRKLTADGAIVPVAFSNHQLSWIKVVGHGLVEPVECPPFFAEFLSENDLVPKRPEAKQAGDIPPTEALTSRELGELIQEFDLIGTNKSAVTETTLDTSMQHSNLAQNIYFSNYFAWQGHLIDKYIFALDPQLYMSMSPKSQFATTRCLVTHLREAMPFDRITITLQLHRIWQRGMDLYLEYFKLAPQDEKIKLAYGHHTLTWASIDETDKYVPQDIPGAFLSKITR
ncbi:MAG: SDR family NAD(P)-dependent oxidoreductase [Nitrospiraceae bacterium]|nr:SDR family NAD(P)-dependent oxidoreductase [Nitrospiraceae bacterium]